MPRSTHGLTLAAMTVALNAAISLPTFAQDAAAVAGCYRFDREYFGWVGRRPGQQHVVSDSTPLLQLSPRRDVAQDPMLDVRPVPFDADTLTEQRWLRLSGWYFRDSVTVNVRWYNGLYGWAFQLGVVRDTLRGHARYLSDIAGLAPPPLKPVHAVRVSCPR